MHEATPVVVSVEDLSALGKSVTSRVRWNWISRRSRRVHVHLVQLEVEIAGQYAIRTEHRIEIIGP